MKSLPLLLAGAAILSALPPAIAQDAALPAIQETVRVVGPDGTAQTVAPVERSDVERYCEAISAPALDARAVLQTAQLQELEREVDRRIDELEAKRAEYEEWLERREAFLQSTSTVMLDIYATMRPDAAAAQLASLERSAAAAIIAQLKSRQASAILTEMPAPVAAELAGLIVARTDPGSAPGAGFAEARS